MSKKWIILSLAAAAAAGFGGMKLYADEKKTGSPRQSRGKPESGY